MSTATLERPAEPVLEPPREPAPAPAAPADETRSSSTWRYLPHAIVVTFGAVLAPIASVGLIQSLTGHRSILMALVMAAAFSIAIASAGSWLWQRRPGSRDILFGDLMLWAWVRRLRTERKLAHARKLLGNQARTNVAVDHDRQIEILEQLAQALDARDPYTHGHSQRVARSAHMIASRMGLHPAEVAKIRVAAAVHDAGKLNTDRAILNKPGALTADEFAVIKRHPADGADLLEPLGDPEIVAMVRHHHERLDGTGYPDGLAGEEIPLGARIIAVADTFDAITSARPYRRARRQQAGLKVLREEAGTRLDAQAVSVFLTYYTARKSAAWSSLTLTLPERALGLITGGAGPLAQGAAATVAAASVGGALVTPALDTRPAASDAKGAVVQEAAGPAARADGPPGLRISARDRRPGAGAERRAERRPAAEGRSPGTRSDEVSSGAAPGTRGDVQQGNANGNGKPSQGNGGPKADSPAKAPPERGGGSRGGGQGQGQGQANGNSGGGNAGGQGQGVQGGGQGSGQAPATPPAQSGGGSGGSGGNSGSGNSGQGNSGSSNSGSGNSGKSG
jgi:hypothetical protein